ncbi:HAD-IC family P-type ATPase, partial [Fulvivirga sp.]
MENTLIGPINSQMPLPHTATVKEIELTLATDISSGLTADEANKRLIIYGRNELQEPTSYNPLIILLAQFKNALTALLFAAALISFLFDDYPESVAILMVILINAFIGFILEFQAHRSMKALKKLEKKWAKVFRDGQLMIIESCLVVPGDILFVEAGDVASADGRIVESVQLEVNQSMLTGESVPVSKNKYPLQADIILAEQDNMFFKGTSATNGNGRVLVTSTGMNTEIGKISEMISGTKKEDIPLNIKLNRLSYRLIWFTLGLIVIFITVGYISGKELYSMIETALALAVAAIPEGLPIVATIALAKGMFKMAKHKVLVKKLAAVETLGETDLIMTDKTGTLTENKLEVHRLSFISHNDDFLVENGQILPAQEDPSMYRLLQVAALCNNGSIRNSEDGIGDPLEIALLRFVFKQNAPLFNTLCQYERYYEKVFDSESRIMITGHMIENHRHFISIKGGPSEVLEKCTMFLVDGEEVSFGENEIKEWKGKIDYLAADGLKVLGFGYKQPADKTVDHLSGFTFIGLIGFLDPPRAEVPMALAQCHEAGIKVVMVTGDHAETAKA